MEWAIATFVLQIDRICSTKITIFLTGSESALVFHFRNYWLNRDDAYTLPDHFGAQTSAYEGSLPERAGRE